MLENLINLVRFCLEELSEIIHYYGFRFVWSKQPMRAGDILTDGRGRYWHVQEVVEQESFIRPETALAIMHHSHFVFTTVDIVKQFRNKLECIGNGLELYRIPEKDKDTMLFELSLLRLKDVQD